MQVAAQKAEKTRTHSMGVRVAVLGFSDSSASPVKTARLEVWIINNEEHHRLHMCVESSVPILWCDTDRLLMNAVAIVLLVSCSNCIGIK